MRTRTAFLFVILLAAILALLSAVPLRAAPTNDAVVNAPCTQTQFDAALNTVQNSGGGTITFNCGGAATITFTKQKKITEDVTIDGGGNITLSGGGTTRLFNAAAGTTFALVNITLADGNGTTGSGGGAVFSKGSVVIDGSTIRDSHSVRGGAVFMQTGSSLVVRNSRFTGNSADITGGAVEVKRATADISTSTFDSNEARFGGGIFVALGTTTLRRVTFSNNTAEAGAGVNNNRGTVALVNVTISNNTANAGAGIGNSGRMTLSFVTLSGNTAGFAGGIYHFGFDATNTLTMSNTILDAGASGQNCYTPAGSATLITTAGFNISSDTSCNSVLTRPSDRNNVDPLLGALANNGGNTMTHLPGAGSPARNNGQCITGINLDQRGVARPQGAACDIGSVESP